MFQIFTRNLQRPVSPSFFSKNSRGFTLIEVLLVLAVIGILAGIVLIAFGPARKQAKDARISSDLVQLQNEAEIIYLEDGDYGNLNCTTGPPEIRALCDDIDKQTGETGSVDIRPSPPTTVYCATAYFNPSSARVFCVDYKGFADRMGSPIPCRSLQLCADVICPDFNQNGRIDGPPEFNSDFDCLSQCINLRRNPPILAGCGSGLPAYCLPCSTVEGCLAIYDLDDDGFVGVVDLNAMGILISENKTCDE